MADFDFTTEQRVLIGTPGSLFVEACPGAGKTQAIVQRFIERPGQYDRRGVALLSFTRAATDEARNRCADHPELIETPNFVGTIDSFINRFIIGPLYTAKEGRLPTFRDTWANAHGGTFLVQAKSAAGIVFCLDWYNYTANGATLDPKRAPGEVKARLDGLPKWLIARSERTAHSMWRRLTDAGYIDCARARILMRVYLAEHDTRVLIQGLLRDRFFEMIVDEGQDCSADDLFLLEFIREAGIALAIVGDFDQAIYGFRGSAVDEVQEFVAGLPKGPRLDGNFRSSRSICAVVDSLRAHDRTDVPVGQWKDLATPVYVMSSPKNFADAHRRVRPILVHEGCNEQDFVYLAHYGYAARAAAGVTVSSRQSTSRLCRLASSAALIAEWSPDSPRDRVKAIADVQYLLRDLAADELKGLPDSEFFESVSLSPRSFLNGCTRLALRQDPRTCDPAAFLQSVRDGVRTLGWSWANTSRLRAPRDNAWPTGLFARELSTQWSKIHGYKGLQAPGVGLVISQPVKAHIGPSAVELWRDGEDGELRRILYVGASRAEKLLVLIVDSLYYDTVINILRNSNAAIKECG